MFDPVNNSNSIYPNHFTHIDPNPFAQTARDHTLRLFGLAQEILGVPQQMTSPPLRNSGSFGQNSSPLSTPSFSPQIDLSNRSWNIGNTHQHNTVIQGSGRQSPEEIREAKEKKERNNRIKTGIVATLILGIGAGLGTYFFTKKGNLNREIEDWKQEIQNWNTASASHLSNDQKIAAQGVFKEATSVLKAKKNALNLRIALAAGVALASLAILGGAIAAIPSLVIAGAVGLGVFSIAFACQLIHSFATNSLERSKKIVDKKIQEFNRPIPTPFFPNYR